MAPFSASTLVRRARAAALGLVPVLALVAAAVAPASAQVRQLPQTPTNPNLPRREVPQAPAGDLVITSVTIKDTPIPTPGTTALVTIQNKGPSAVAFPAGSVLARGDAGTAGGVAFQALTTPSDYTIDAGASKQLTLSVGDVCAAGKAGTVVFKVDPDGKVHEANEGNNSFSVSNVAPFATGDLAAVSVGLKSTAPSYGTDKNAGIAAGYAANLEVMIRSNGSGPALICPGEVMFKETASPVSGKYGLRTAKFGGPAKVLLSGTATVWSIPNAMAAGDLPPGTYAWAVQVNPDGRTPETSNSNNAASAPVPIH